VPDQKDKPVFDEQTLARVLEAAYVLQEHNRALELNLELQSGQLREEQAESLSPHRYSAAASEDNSASKDDDYTLVLAQIVETQHQIQVRQLELENAVALVAERLTQITGASGAGIGIVEGKSVFYRAGSGTSALPRGTKLPMEKALCFTSLRTGQVMRCPDVNPEFLLDAEECHRRGIHSLVAVPVYHDGGIVGALELFFGKVNGYTEHDVHTCQLMAGQVTEALARDAQLTWKKSLTTERATILEALERLKPNLSALVQPPVAREAYTEEPAPAAVTQATFACRKCGHSLMSGEQFCGKCGTPRISESELPSMQSKVASLWQMNQGHGVPPLPPNGAASSSRPQEEIVGDEPNVSAPRPENPELNEDRRDRELARLLANSVPDFSVMHDPADVARLAVPPRVEHRASSGETLSENPVTSNEVTEDVLIPATAGAETAETENRKAHAAETKLQKTDHDITWTSAARARDFLEQVTQSNTRNAFQLFWNARRGDIYLAVAVMLMAVVIRWGIWSDHAVSATGSGSANISHRKPEADLSMFDRLLINIGLAEPPDKAEPKGNPETQVWIDLHTALYYCPGTDLYGKTPKGKFTSQKDAQLDQFEPAYRKACD
jgi:putative methionine-R-sulfoxide reductase with GAF domain